MQASATCRAVAASFDIAPSTAGKWIREQVRARPGITVRELARRVSEHLGPSVGRDAVLRFPKRCCGLSFKKMTCVADEPERPDVNRRERWMRHQGRIGPERLVFLDETCVKTNMAPLRGWGPKGECLPGPAPFGHWNTSTFIAEVLHATFRRPCGNPRSRFRDSPAPRPDGEESDVEVGRCRAPGFAGLRKTWRNSPHGRDDPPAKIIRTGSRYSR